MAENKGKIDVAAAQKFMADHYDTYLKKDSPSERTLCGHIDLSTRGSSPGSRRSARRARCRTKPPTRP